jgi:hypothetical protein
LHFVELELVVVVLEEEGQVLVEVVVLDEEGQEDVELLDLVEQEDVLERRQRGTSMLVDQWKVRDFGQRLESLSEQPFDRESS